MSKYFSVERNFFYEKTRDLTRVFLHNRLIEKFISIIRHYHILGGTVSNYLAIQNMIRFENEQYYR